MIATESFAFVVWGVYGDNWHSPLRTGRRLPHQSLLRITLNMPVQNPNVPRASREAAHRDAARSRDEAVYGEDIQTRKTFAPNMRAHYVVVVKPRTPPT